MSVLVYFSERYKVTDWSLPIRWSGMLISACMAWTSPCGGICWALRSACWVSLCLLRSTFLWNARPHRSQAKGLKPVCLREWVMRFELWLNALPQTWHLCGFSPVDKEVEVSFGIKSLYLRYSFVVHFFNIVVWVTTWDESIFVRKFCCFSRFFNLKYQWKFEHIFLSF